MDLSILIPVYRWDVSRLTRDLDAQAQTLGVRYEILVADDEQLRLGRARIRNHLAEQAVGRWLLFIDCDAGVESATFLRDYLSAAERGAASIVCGGLHHAATMPSAAVSLRWRYERRADRHRTARCRQRRPCEHFTPFNFLIDRELFLSIRFDERVAEYGHEDTLFGRALAERGITPLHIDNPLVHLGLESNAQYLEKTRAALRSLSRFRADLRGYSSVLSAYALLQRLHLAGIAATLFTRHGSVLERQLLGTHPSLFLFKLYKLGYFATLKTDTGQASPVCNDD